MTADLARLFEEYYPSLVRMLYRRTGDRDRAEDLAQETFARAVSAPPDNPRPWLFAVALNLVREDGRKAVTRGRRLELLRNEQDRPAAGPDADYERNEDVARVKAALARLNESLRSVSVSQREYRLNPHLSLIYKKMLPETKAQIANSLSLPFGEVEFDAVKAVISPAKIESRADVEAWRVLAAEGLTG